ncbi:MAG: hypothetical protein IJ662_09800 [Clostridia bacterium]|nr:hypothetical protein [Clostridia bacterium]
MYVAEERLKAASAIHFPAAKIGFLASLEVENPFLQEMDVPNQSGIFIPI